MKIISRYLIVAATLFISSIAFAQDENNPWVVTIATNAIDTYPTGKTGNKAVGNTENFSKNSILQKTGILSHQSHQLD